MLTQLAASLDMAFAANMASNAIVRVLAVKCALATDNWRTFLSDLQESATLDLECLPLPVDSMERRAAIRVAALDCLAASLNDLAQRLSAGERCGLPHPGDWIFPTWTRCTARYEYQRSHRDDCHAPAARPGADERIPDPGRGQLLGVK